MPAAMSWLGAPIDPADAAARWPHRTESAEAPKHYERCRLSGQEIKPGDAVAVRGGEWDSKADKAKHQTTQQKLAKGNSTKGSTKGSVGLKQKKPEKEWLGLVDELWQVG